MLKSLTAHLSRRHHENAWQTPGSLGGAALLLGALFSLSSCSADLEASDQNRAAGDMNSPSGPGACEPDCTGRSCGDDGCGGVCGTCPDGIACNPIEGSCALLCGDGKLDPGESCDPPGSCPANCEAPDEACMSVALEGTAASCSAQCVTTAITACSSGDGCCAPGCDAVSDDDCVAICGNGVFEPGELCGDGGPACPTSCDDDDLCTEDTLEGSSETCDLRCEHQVLDPCALDQARGVGVGDITVDQGIRIPVREEGTLLEPNERNAQLVTNRATLVRASWTLEAPESHVTRDIRALLTLTHEDGTTEELEEVKEVGVRTEYSYDDARDAFVFELASEQVKKGMALSLELFEVDESYRSQPPPTTPSRFPAEAESNFPLGLDAEPSKMHVVLVPIYHNLGSDCPAAPDLYSVTDRGGEEMPEHEYYRQRLIANNPVSDAELRVHEIVEFNGSAESSGDIFTLLRQTREADNAEDWEFYYGVIEPCDNGPSFSGVASRPGHGDDGLPDRNDGSRRTGWGDYREDGRHAGTFVHEIGHEQGRQHVDCGGPASPDPDYPNSEGEIGAWGWDIYSGIFHPADEKDYMSYCGPRWISEYGWNLMQPWIAEMSQWPLEQLETTPTPMLYATVQPGRSTQWWTGSATGDKTAQSSHSVDYYSGEQLILSAPAEREEVEEQAGAFFLSAPRPQEWSKITHIVHRDAHSMEVIDASSVLQIR